MFYLVQDLLISEDINYGYKRMLLLVKINEKGFKKLFPFFMLLFFIPYLCNAKKLVSESSGFLENVSSHKIADGTEYRIFTIKGHFKNNAGIYGITDCNGYRETKNNALLFLKVVCENITQHGDSFFTLGERKSEYNKAGVGRLEYIDGTGIFKNLIGINCVYAVNKVLKSDFAVTKCDISDKIYNDLKKYSEK